MVLATISQILSSSSDGFTKTLFQPLASFHIKSGEFLPNMSDIKQVCERLSGGGNGFDISVSRRGISYYDRRFHQTCDDILDNIAIFV